MWFNRQVAGAAAAGGMSLERVKEVAAAALRAMGTMGVALSGCTLPGAAPSDRRGRLWPDPCQSPRQHAGLYSRVGDTQEGGCSSLRDA